MVTTRNQLERTAFTTRRDAEYFDARQLSALTGVPASEFASVCLKELVDNALDACETAGVAPEIAVDVSDEQGAIRLSVSDTGPGIPSEVVRKVLDYSVRVSDKAAYRSPTRGAQGNALKTIIGIPYALGAREPITIVARGGVVHTIEPSIDPAGNVRISHHEGNGRPWSGGSTVEALVAPDYGIQEDLVQDFDPHHWVRSFATFNPHATLRYQLRRTLQKRSKFTNRPARRSGSTSRLSPRARTGTVPSPSKRWSSAT